MKAANSATKSNYYWREPLKAVGLYKYLPIDLPESLLDVEVDKPEPKARELLVKVNAIAVNPVDTKMRSPQDKVEDTARILGWDAAGTVESVGSEVSLFKVGEEVFYAGSFVQPGCNSEFHIVDERIVGTKPSTLDFSQAAAMPLTSITAWEALFDRLMIDTKGADAGKNLLIIGGAGGVGSMALQLAKQLAQLTVTVTCSRPESRAWCKELGADHIINHYLDIPEQVAELDIDGYEYILCLNDTDEHWFNMATVITPQGKICSIVETAADVDLGALKSKSATFVWEFMFTRSMYETPDMIEQHYLLNNISKLVEADKVKTTVNKILKPINAKNLKLAHAEIEARHTIGKIVLQDWN